jgi:cytochrome c-type biogenesis protein CcmF
MTLPVIMAVFFLLGVGPALPWRRAEPGTMTRRLRIPAVMLALTALVTLAAGERNPYAVLAFAFAAFAMTTNLQEFWIGAAARRKAHGEAPHVALARLFTSNRHRYGGYLAHIGILVMAVGVTASSVAVVEKEATLAPGESMETSGMTFRLEEVWAREAAHRFTVGADLTVLREGREIARMSPRQHFYPSSDQPIPTPAVESGIRRDLYVNLMAFDQNGASATLRVLVEPLVMWIWLGGGIVCLGAAITLLPNRRRVAEATAAAPAARRVRKRGRPAVPAEVVS